MINNVHLPILKVIIINSNLFYFSSQREKIDRIVAKMNIMKKLMTNMIASMCRNLHDNRDLIDILVKHKSLINFEDLRDEANGQSSQSGS